MANYIMQNSGQDLDNTVTAYKNGTLKTAVENTLTSTSVTSALSANQGRILHELINGNVIMELGTLNVNLNTNDNEELDFYTGQGIYKFNWYEPNTGHNINSILFVSNGESTTQFVVDDFIGIAQRIAGDNWHRVLDEQMIVNTLTSTATGMALSAAQGKVLKDLVESKAAHSYGTGGGFTGGALADLITGGGGAALGNASRSENGGAVGNNAYSSDGGAVGDGVITNSGFAGGSGASSTAGAAVGTGANASDGGAVGSGALCTNGGAVGQNARAGDGFAGGKNAYAVNVVDDGIDAIQLGMGTNSTPKTMQVYDKRIVEADGSLTDVGALSGLLTTVKTSVVAAINELHANTGVPAGTVIYYAAATPPAGYLKCDGSAVSRTAYSALFAVIGTTYGAGDGSTTFQLPDLRAEFLRGYDDGRGIDTDRVFGSSQEGTQLYLGSFNATWYGTDGEENADNASSSKISGTSSSTGSSSSIRVRPRNVAMLACIKY